MRKVEAIVVCLVSAIATVALAAPEFQPGKATVKRIQGKCQYQVGDNWNRVKVNQPFGHGVVFRTASDSSMDVSVNGLSSALRLEPDTTLAIPEMSRTSLTADADTQTKLDLRNGTILGNVKKLSANSQYEINTPHGLAAIRGTDFLVTAALQPDGNYAVTFTSITGQLLVSAQETPIGINVVRILRDGQSWTPGKDRVHPTPSEILIKLCSVFSPKPRLADTVHPIPDPVLIQPFAGGGQPLPPRR